MTTTEPPLETYAPLMVAPYSGAMVDRATDILVPVVGARGWSAVSAQCVAEGADVSRQAVHQRFGPRARLQAAVADRFTARWVRWSMARFVHGGLPGLLPDGEDSLLWTRVWLAITEGAARDPWLAELVAVGRRNERELITSVLRASPGPDAEPQEPAVSLLHGLLEGLRLGLSSQRPTSSWSEARVLLDRTTTALRTNEALRLLD